MWNYKSGPLHKPKMLSVSGKQAIYTRITVLTYPTSLYYNTLHLIWSPHISMLFSPDAVILSDHCTHLWASCSW